jgi:hypothetical protein
MTPRRLDAEEVRDAMLAVSGELAGEVGGASVDGSAPRRSVYVKVLRNKRERVLDAFDAPESFCSVASRNATTTATQSLRDDQWRMAAEAPAAFAARVRREAASQGLVDPGRDRVSDRARSWPQRRRVRPSAEVRHRSPIPTPLAGAGLDVGLVDLCHVLLNSNEFLYVD